MNYAIQLNQISLNYNQQPVFADLSLTVPTGKWIAILGKSGVGKTTLLRLLAGISALDEKINGTKKSFFSPSEVAYMTQADSLLPWLSVINNATLSVRLRKHKKAQYQAKIEAATALLTQVGLSNYLHFYPDQLSGGMRQRVALVRTLLEEKPVILLDEPFASLDAITRYELQNLTASLLKNKTVLFVTHDPSEALRLADEIYILHGEPAKLTRVAMLDSSVPRELSDPEISQLQTKLFQQLTELVQEKS
ncbi:MAG: hypothetical protein ACD_46C00268G0008 [uncultured bacterium]|nr:MAG: hypothetical protein ACD_46C00268G0008 [uncultured bacterium]